jgi:hypothetical protein
MPVCKTCGEEVDELVTAEVNGKAKKMCADCAERAEEDAAVGAESEAVVQRMMEYKGKR